MWPGSVWVKCQPGACLAGGVFCTQARVYQDDAGCRPGAEYFRFALCQNVPGITSTVIFVNDDWDSDGEPGEPESLTGESAGPIPWRSYLTARMPSSGRGWRMPVWLFLLVMVLAVIAGFVFHLHSHCGNAWTRAACYWGSK
jgi:hypothetical protein